MDKQEFLDKLIRIPSEDDLDQPIVKLHLREWVSTDEECIPVEWIGWGWPGFWKELVRHLPHNYIIHKVTLKFRGYERVVVDEPHETLYLIDGAWRDDAGGNGGTISVGYGWLGDSGEINKDCYTIPVICKLYEEIINWKDIPEELRRDQDLVSNPH